LSQAPPWLARVVLAILPIVVPSVMAGLGPHETALSRKIGVIEMGWRVERERDLASGKRTCTLISWGRDVIVQLHRPNRGEAPVWSVMVGFDNQPGSVRYLRVNRKYFTTAEPAFRGSEAKEIVQLLKSPGVFAFEWAKRPDHSKRQGLFGTGDFAAKAAACEGWVNRIQSIQVVPPRPKGQLDALRRADMPHRRPGYCVRWPRCLSLVVLGTPLL
jgi:hypothetical protein